MNAKRLLPVLLVLLGAPAARAAVDPFYQGLLRDGQYAYDRKDFATAARDLRLACFGMLDEPRQLAGCLARLALAQDAGGDVDGFRETFRRLVEAEDRFKGYSQGELPADLRSTLETRLAARLPAATLAAAPAFRSTQQAAATPGKKPTAAPPAEKPSEKPSEKTVEPVKPAPATTASPAPAAPKGLSDADRQKLEQARQLLGDQRTAKELRQAFDLARGVADAHPESKEAQLLAAEGAYRISRWKEATSYFQRGGDPGEDQPERLFYMAISLYETGDRTGAAALLKRSLPNLKRTSYVDGYAKKILGQ